MQYTITGQISISPLDANFKECDDIKAKYQLEIYDIKSTRKKRVGIVRQFNNKQFSYPVNSQVGLIAHYFSNGILLAQTKDANQRG